MTNPLEVLMEYSPLGAYM